MATPGGFNVPQQRLQQRSERVVDLYVPFGSVSERIVEQVVDVSMPSVELFTVQDSLLGRPPTRAASSSLGAPQEHFVGFFLHFSLAPKKCERWASVDCRSRRRVQLTPYGGFWL